MATADAKQTSTIHTNYNESFISDHYKDSELEAQTIKKKKKSQKLIFQGTKAVTKGSAMMN